MAIKTYTEQLEEVQTAISRVLGTANASVTILGRSFTKHNIGELQKYEEYLRPRAARESRGGRKINRVVPL